MRCSLLSLAVALPLVDPGLISAQQIQADPPPQPLELIAPGSNPQPRSAILKEPATVETVPPRAALSQTIEETLPPVLVPPPFYPPPSASTAGMPPPSFSSPYVPYEAGPQIPPYGESWRYMTASGVNWYYNPQRQWMYWCQGRWVQYQPPAYSNTPVGLQPPQVSRRFRRAAAKVGVGGGAPSFSAPYPGY